MVLAEPTACFEEEMELEDSVEELDPLAFLLGRLLDQLCARLMTRSLAANVIHLRFDLDPAGQKDVQIRNDGSRRKKKSSIYEKTLTLPVPMRDSKMLLSLLRLQLQGDPPPAPILKLFMAAEAAKPRAMQAGLFLPSSPDVAKLELTIARLANLVGESNIGSPQLIDTHRPGEFRMDRFIPPSQENKKPRRKRITNPNSCSSSLQRSMRKPRGLSDGAAVSSQQASSPEVTIRNFSAVSLAAEIAPSAVAAKPAIGFRMFRPPLSAKVHFSDGESLPKHIFFRGVRGEVLAASGPWRTSGDWWREDAWHQDEWDLEIRFSISPDRTPKNPASRPQHGLYRFYFDSIAQGWFVRGIYD
jgi:hypothetical protein